MKKGLQILLLLAFGFGCNSPTKESNSELNSDEQQIVTQNQNPILSKNSYEFDTCVWISSTEMKNIDVKKIDKLLISIRLINSGTTEKIERITGYGDKEIEERAIYFDSLTYFGLCNYKPKSYWNLNSPDSLGKILFVNNIKANPQDSVSNGNLLFLKFVNGFGKSIVTTWQKIDEQNIKFQQTLGRFFNDGKYSGSSIDSIYKINEYEFIITGNRDGGDGGYTEGGIWIASWRPGTPMKLLKTFDFILYGYSAENINYTFDEKKMEITFSAEEEKLKEIIPKNTIKIIKN